MAKPLTLEERKFIEMELSKGSTSNFIAIKLGRSPSTLKQELQIAGGRLKYNAYKTHEESETKERIRRENLGKRARESNKKLKWLERVKSLEMQVQILSETIKELLNASRNK